MDWNKSLGQKFPKFLQYTIFSPKRNWRLAMQRMRPASSTMRGGTTKSISYEIPIFVPLPFLFLCYNKGYGQDY